MTSCSSRNCLVPSGHRAASFVLIVRRTRSTFPPAALEPRPGLPPPLERRRVSHEARLPEDPPAGVVRDPEEVLQGPRVEAVGALRLEDALPDRGGDLPARPPRRLQDGHLPRTRSAAPARGPT